MAEGKCWWDCKLFEQLSLDELYAIMIIRQEIFIAEQNCPYVDADGKDQKSFHVLGYNVTNELVSYSRIVKPGVTYDEVCIGRVTCRKAFRKEGIGIELMNTTLNFIADIYGQVPVRIGAQSWLLKFYEKFGFASTGHEFLEDGIPHTEMLKTKW